MSIRIGPAVVTYTLEGALTTYDDGTTWGAQPHDTLHYDEIAGRCGYHPSSWLALTVAGGAARAAARLAYCREHEVVHHLVGEVFYGGPSPVLWALAHGRDVEPQAAALEEAMVMLVQRWVRAGERPIIGGVNWDGLKARALALLEVADA